MRRLRVLGTWSLVLLALVALLGAPMAVPAEAGHLTGSFTGFGGCPGFGTSPGFGGCPGFGTSPGFGACPGFGRFPGFGVTAPRAAPAAPTNRVRLSMGDNFFLPAEISVPVGTQVAWVNNGRNQHTVTSPGIWDSGVINPGGRWAAIFAVAGTFEYLCTIHPDEMRGRLIVTLP